ncbi:MAG: diaminopimelate epimerase [Thermodesulfobacteriota bacterium]
MKIPFTKMSGSGNDFILIDHRNPFIPEEQLKRFVRKVCRRKLSVGADGLILIEESKEGDFKWRFFNSDGSEAEMCGNGGRCVARFAYLKGIAPSSMRFETLAGMISANVDGKRVKLEMTEPHSLRLDEKILIEGRELTISRINTGVPHAVLFLKEIDQTDVVDMGRVIRFHPYYAPTGVNVNFVKVENNAQLSIRTYERGVEDETLACGTGVVASTLIAALKGFVKSPVSVKTRGGEILTVHFDVEGGKIRKVFFEGEVHIIYEGEIWEEAYS